MIAGLIGTIQAVAADAVTVNVNGVIYRVNTSSRTGPDAGGRGSAVELHTHMVVRDDALFLFGFLTENELVWFETLIGVNGVGPRLACAVLSRFSPDELLSAISAEEIALLSTVPGIGKRTASRILLDLRGKLPENLEPTGPLAMRSNPEVLGALQALGYTTAEALTAISSLPEDAPGSTEEQVLEALRILGGT
ncbi:MAG: Holliday junction branch migration protein RuvA [Chloroflexia bacterium]|nr:Holliday junction branch migration protein RuvA [Chloroflexia bacterium]